MSTLSELIDEGKKRKVTFFNKDDKQLLELSLLWAVIIAFGAPQLALLVLLLVLLEILNVKVDEKQLGLVQDK
ncbi:MAG: DUF4342 domain-containing protein [Gammaproteobacteria bacterium]|nr:DUF4342 domain-containing protein [Phycisphaerae bacterium]NIW50104.1 DUF4342 domain-containing protein [Gammaproteobacteria bacterium]